jgi:uncharacterized protein DUF6174
MSPAREDTIGEEEGRSVRSRPRVGLVGLAFLALAMLGCSSTAPAPRAAAQRELARNRVLWTAAGIHDYEFDYQLLCFCASEVTEQVHIIVRHDAIESVVRKRDGLPAGTKYGWPRIGELFADIQSRLDHHAERITVDYDPTYGYPRSIVVDVALMAADDEYSHTAGNLRPLP